MPKTKPILVSILYRPPNQQKFLEMLSSGLEKLELEKQEAYMLGDFNINLMQDGAYAFNKKCIIQGKTTLQNPLLKPLFELCNLFGLTQLIRDVTHVTCHSSTLIDHIFTNSERLISQCGVLNIGLSDHQMIFCTRKVTRTKFYSHKSISVRSMKNYSKESLISGLNELNFPDYNSFNDVNKAYNDFSNRVMSVIDNLYP